MFFNQSQGKTIFDEIINILMIKVKKKKKTDVYLMVRKYLHSCVVWKNSSIPEKLKEGR